MNTAISSAAFILLINVAKHLRNFRTNLKSPNLEYVKATLVQNLDSLGLKE